MSTCIPVTDGTQICEYLVGSQQENVLTRLSRKEKEMDERERGNEGALKLPREGGICSEAKGVSGVCR